MSESYEINKQQLYLLITVSVFLAGLVFVFGFVVGNKNDTKQTTHSSTDKENGWIHIEKTVAILPTESASQTQSISKDINAELTTELDVGVNYSVQITSVEIKENAINLKMELEAKGYPAYISKIEYDNKKAHYRVRVGPYTDQDSADKICREIYKKLGMKGLALRTDNDKGIK